MIAKLSDLASEPIPKAGNWRKYSLVEGPDLAIFSLIEAHSRRIDAALLRR